MYFFSPISKVQEQNRALKRHCRPRVAVSSSSVARTIAARGRTAEGKEARPWLQGQRARCRPPSLPLVCLISFCMYWFFFLVPLLIVSMCIGIDRFALDLLIYRISTMKRPRTLQSHFSPAAQQSAQCVPLNQETTQSNLQCVLPCHIQIISICLTINLFYDLFIYILILFICRSWRGDGRYQCTKSLDTMYVFSSHHMYLTIFLAS